MKSVFDTLNFRTGLTARNRVALAAMTNQQSHQDGSLSQAERDWLESRAEGGFGLITTGAAHVSRDGQGWAGELGIFDDTLLPGLNELATALRRRGAISMVQIFHGGVRADSKVTGIVPISASEFDGAREASEDDIHRLVGDYRDAALRARSAGFDGVEIHGAHGYLITQFLSATQNRRSDAWGGNLEGRARFAREVVRAVRQATGTGFTVGIRISPEDHGHAKGLDLDENVQLAQWLAEDGIDFLHLSLWRSLLNTRKRPDQHAIPLFRDALPGDVALLAAGGIYTRDDAETVLQLGADGIALARSAILNPSWPLDVRDDAWEPRRPPATAEALHAFGLSAPFVQYMRGWKDFVV